MSELAVKERVLIVDDDPQILTLLERILEGAGYRCTCADRIEAARGLLTGAPFDLLLCDVGLPDGSGLDLVEFVANHHPHIASVMVSGLDDVSVADRALDVGAFGYILKPFSANDVLRSLMSAASRRRYDLDLRDELKTSSEETIERLCIAVEAWDTETAVHNSQMSQHCGNIALEMGFSRARADLIRTASKMHDVGKIGIADAILQKPGPLTEDERAQMQKHTEIGYRILAGSGTELLQVAAQIAWTHHERFDGDGYPCGVVGTDIPVEGRIAAVADVYDALTRDRVYRPRFSNADARLMLEDGRGTHFDPMALDAFNAVLDRSRATA